MKTTATFRLLSIPALLAASGIAGAACVYPQAPQALPNGANATKEEMVAAQGSIKEYKTAVEGEYLNCLEKEKTDALAAIDPADPEFEAKKAAVESIHAKRHNAAVDELQAVASRWNEEIKAFQAKSKQ
jgi:hypothetical protein